jgi:ABC-2 type transport system ATP-binding protein
MAEVAERKMTVLVSSHNLRELEDICDHVGIMHHGKIMIERSLSDLQGNISKIQVACQNGVPKLPDDFEVLHMANTGRVYTLIVKGDPKEAEKVPPSRPAQTATPQRNTGLIPRMLIRSPAVSNFLHLYN